MLVGRSFFFFLISRRLYPFIYGPVFQRMTKRPKVVVAVFIILLLRLLLFNGCELHFHIGSMCTAINLMNFRMNLIFWTKYDLINYVHETMSSDVVIVALRTDALPTEFDAM